MSQLICWQYPVDGSNDDRTSHIHMPVQSIVTVIPHGTGRARLTTRLLLLAGIEDAVPPSPIVNLLLVISVVYLPIRLACTLTTCARTEGPVGKAPGILAAVRSYSALIESASSLLICSKPSSCTVMSGDAKR